MSRGLPVRQGAEGQDRERRDRHHHARIGIRRPAKAAPGAGPGLPGPAGRPESVPGRQTVDAGEDQAPRKRLLPDLSGTTIGTWQVLYEAREEKKRHCMCRCVRCGVKKIILSFKLRERYALRCPECRIRRQLAGA